MSLNLFGGLVKGTGRMVGRAGTTGWRSVGNLGSHTKGLLVGSGLAYGGWRYLQTGRLPGQGILEKGADVMGKTVDAANKGVTAIDKGLGYVNDGLDKVPEIIRDTKNALVGDGSGEAAGQVAGLSGGLFGGIKNLLGGIFGGGGIGSMLGLAASVFMFFGSFGWLGKIGGVLLAALSLGLFGGNSRQQTVQQSPVRAESRQDIAYPSIDMGGEEHSSPTIHRSR